MCYFLCDDKRNHVAWDTFKEFNDCFISDTKYNNLLVGQFIKIKKETDEVLFVKTDGVREAWLEREMIYAVPLLINI